MRPTAPLLLLLLLAPSVGAGDADLPEVPDDGGDAEPAALDIASAWLAADEATLRFTVALRSLASPHPTDAGHAQHVYAISYKLSSHERPLLTEVVVSLTESTSSVGSGGTGADVFGFLVTAGTTVSTRDDQGRSIGGVRARFDPATDLLTIDVPRQSSSLPIPPATYVSAIAVRSYASDRPYGGGQTTLGDDADGRTLVDEALGITKYLAP